MPKINKIKIKNFRSIKSISLETNELSIFVGNNDSGKSNIFRALNLFFNGKTDGKQDFDFNVDFNRFAETNRRAAEIEIELELEIPKNYHKTNGEYIVWKKTWRREGLWERKTSIKGYSRSKKKGKRKIKPIEVEIPAKSNVHSLLAKIEFEYIPAIRSSDYIRELRGRIYGIISQLTEANFRERSREFEAAISENVQALINNIDDDLNETTSLKLPNDLSDIFRSLDFLSGDKSISLNQRGDGIKGRYIPLILKFMADKKSELQNKGASPHTFIWAYEEPENNLEYTRAQELATLFSKMASDNDIQVLLTTHSPVFYNLDNRHEQCNLNYIKNGDMAGTQSIPTLKNSLDLEMGVLPLITPYLENAQQEIDDLRLQLKSTETQLNNERKSVVFVEGTSDFVLYKKIIDHYLTPEEKSGFILVSPPARAGANYVTNMLRAWEYNTRHKAVDDRKKALGIVDNDKEGGDAEGRFLIEFKRGVNRFSVLVKNEIPNHLEQLFQVGFTIPICLEELLPHDQWEFAEQQGWLSERCKKSICSQALHDHALEDEKSPLQYIENEWKLFCQKEPNAEYKTAWADHIVSLPNNDFECATTHIFEWFRGQLISINALDE